MLNNITRHTPQPKPAKAGSSWSCNVNSTSNRTVHSPNKVDKSSIPFASLATLRLSGCVHGYRPSNLCTHSMHFTLKGPPNVYHHSKNCADYDFESNGRTVKVDTMLKASVSIESIQWSQSLNQCRVKNMFTLKPSQFI